MQRPVRQLGHETDPRSRAVVEVAAEAGAALEVVRLRRRFGERPLVHLDVASRPVLAVDPARGFAGEIPADSPVENLSPLVIEADGTVVPLQYGFGRRYALGNIVDEPLEPMLARWRRDGRADFLELCQRVYREQVSADSPSPFFNWYGAMREASLVTSTPVARPARHSS